MSEHFIKYIDIESYKCFQNFSAKGFKRVNLISGKNNVGKTAFMESLLFNLRSISVITLMHSLWITEAIRNYSDYIDTRIDENALFFSTYEKNDFIGISSNLYRCSVRRNKDTASFDVNIDTDTVEFFSSKDLDFNSHDLITKDHPLGFIGSMQNSKERMRKSFMALQQQDREDELYRFITEFDPNIKNVKIMGGDKIQCRVEENDGFKYRDIGDFGDGLRQYISIIIDLYALRNRFLFIDEIDNGIHYSSLDRLWEIILNLSREQNVQVFATTHSRECIESYCRVAKKLDDQDISFTTLVKNKSKQIRAITYDYEAFTNSIDQGHEVRGW